MEKFNITNSIKRDLARKVKKEIGDNDYTELAIMYKSPTFSEDGHFYLTETINIQKLETETEDCHYKTFTHYKADGKITLKEIENLIFG